MCVTTCKGNIGCFCALLNLCDLYLQVVVHRVLLNLLVELGSCHFLVEQRELQVIEHYTLIIKGLNFILVCTDIYGAAKMILISFVDRFRLFLIGRCGRKDFSLSAFLCNFGSADLLLFKPLRIEFLFFLVQVSIHFDKLRDTLFNLIPIQQEFYFFAIDFFSELYSFSIVQLVNARSNDNRVRAAPSVLIFQELYIFLFG